MKGKSMKIHVHDLDKEEFLGERLIVEHTLGQTAEVTLSDGSVKNMLVAELAHHLLHWKFLRKEKVPVTSSEVCELIPFSAKTEGKLMNLCYMAMIRNNVTVEKALTLTMNMIEYTNNTIMKYHQRWAGTLDALSLASLRTRPEIKDIIDVTLEQKDSSGAVECKLDQATDKLVDALMSIDVAEGNQLRRYLEASTIKVPQLGQVMIAYGTRTDVDMSIKQNKVGGSSAGGLEGVTEHAIEQLASKVAVFQHKDAIRNPQATARVLRICCSSVNHLYRGSCGSNGTIPITITESNSNILTDATIQEGGKSVWLTKDEIKKRIGKSCNFFSPCMCRYTDGVCETCLGWAGGMGASVLPPVNIGTFSAADYASVIGQMILSTKHNSGTNTKGYTLPAGSDEVFALGSHSIIANYTAKKAANFMFRIPIDDVGSISALTQETNVNTTSFSTISEIGIVDENHRVVKEFDLSTKTTIPHFSQDALKILSDSVRKIGADDTYIYIPLRLFSRGSSVFSVTTLSDDMVAFSKELTSFFTNKQGGLEGYTSFPDAVSHLVNISSEYMTTKLFQVQAVLRSLMLDPAGGPSLPIVTDPNNVRFGNLKTVASTRSTSQRMVLGHFNLWFEDMNTYLTKTGDSVYDVFFGL